VNEREQHVLLEGLMAAAIRAADPGTAFAELAGDERLPPAWRAQLADMDPDGVRISGLLVAQLRFQRLMHCSGRARRFFDEDPAGFARAFRAYHTAVAPSEVLPAGEARLFDAWLDDQPVRTP